MDWKHLHYNQVIICLQYQKKKILLSLEIFLLNTSQHAEGLVFYKFKNYMPEESLGWGEM
jgi:hypothetical protein